MDHVTFVCFLVVSGSIVTLGTMFFLSNQQVDHLKSELESALEKAALIEEKNSMLQQMVSLKRAE